MKTIYEFLLKNKTTTSTQDTDYVDLGLPSGLLWATCNIGAEEPTDYGDYFMWGSTKPDTDKSCNWAHAPFNNGSYDCDEDYFESIKNKVCPNGILAPEYDAATVILGDDWRLPTADEIKELIDNTNHEWVENYQGSRIKGMVFTPAVFTPMGFEANGNELFIPASWYRGGPGFNIGGSAAYLWGSSLDTSSPYCASGLHFNDSSCNMRKLIRYYGLCLRGVKENK